ncbi:uncharacterized protein LOC114601368 [Podarcis muralis]
MNSPSPLLGLSGLFNSLSRLLQLLPKTLQNVPATPQIVLVFSFNIYIFGLKRRRKGLSQIPFHYHRRAVVAGKHLAGRTRVSAVNDDLSLRESVIKGFTCGTVSSFLLQDRYLRSETHV